jgi:hypothetical protein
MRRISLFHESQLRGLDSNAGLCDRSIARSQSRLLLLLLLLPRDANVYA